MEDWRRPYVTAFKTVASISFVLGISLLSVSLWVVICIWEDGNTHIHNVNELSNKPVAYEFRLFGILANTKDNARSLPTNNNNENDTTSMDLNTRFNESENGTNTGKSVINEVKSYLGNLSSFQASSGVATICGIIQIVTCMAILISSSKGAINPIREKLWKTIHLIVALVLVVILIVLITNSSIQNSSEHEMLSNEYIFLTTLAVDSAGLIILVIITHFLLDCFRVK